MVFYSPGTNITEILGYMEAAFENTTRLLCRSPYFLGLTYSSLISESTPLRPICTCDVWFLEVCDFLHSGRSSFEVIPIIQWLMSLLTLLFPLSEVSNSLQWALGRISLVRGALLLSILLPQTLFIVMGFSSIWRPLCLWDCCLLAQVLQMSWLLTLMPTLQWTWMTEGRGQVLFSSWLTHLGFKKATQLLFFYNWSWVYLSSVHDKGDCVAMKSIGKPGCASIRSYNSLYRQPECNRLVHNPAHKPSQNQTCRYIVSSCDSWSPWKWSYSIAIPIYTWSACGHIHETSPLVTVSLDFVHSWVVLVPLKVKGCRCVCSMLPVTSESVVMKGWMVLFALN